MRVFNRTKGREIAAECVLAEDLWARTRGLLGHQPLQPGEGMIIRPCQAIHTFLMTFPIDVIFASRHDRVVYLVKAMSPNRLSPPVLGARYVIELPVGAIEASGTGLGDQLDLLE